MPAWAKDAREPAHFYFLDLILDVARHYGWTLEYCLDMPVRRWWMTVDHLRRHREQLAEAAKDNPLAALMLMSR